ncbi:MAG: histidinol-phosphate transaminase, partial [Parvibaculales bacterium]
MTGPIAKDGILDMPAYVGGKEAVDGIADPFKLSANENPLGTSQSVQLARKIPSNAAEYPDPDSSELRNKIG